MFWNNELKVADLKRNQKGGSCYCFGEKRGGMLFYQGLEDKSGRKCWSNTVNKDFNSKYAFYLLQCKTCKKQYAEVLKHNLGNS